jgi:hypothetical protein
MTQKNTEMLIRLDEGSANVIRGLVEQGVGCHQTHAVPAEVGLFQELRFGLFCKELIRQSSESTELRDQQCVVMGGFVERCPLFGVLPNGQSLGMHEQIGKLAELQRNVTASLTHSNLGNFNTVSGSKLDKS